MARSISKAMNMTIAQSIILKSIFRTKAFSSAHVHLAVGSKRWKFSLVRFSFSLTIRQGVFEYY